MRRLAVAGVLAAVIAMPRGSAAAGVELTPAQRDVVLSLSPLPPLRPDPTNAVADDPRAAALGRRLFFDTRLSANGKLACASCHVPELGFADGLARARGRAELTRHAPSLWNVAYQRWFFWDGRADALWAQALVPLEHPDEMGGSRAALVARLREDADLRASYEALFGSLPPQGASSDDVTRAAVNALKCVAAYERTLCSGSSAFDRYVQALREGRGAADAAMSIEAQRGLVLFVGRAGCVTCHSGPLLSDREFHDTRVAPLGGGAPADPGRYDGVAKLRAAELSAACKWSDAPACAQATLTRRTLQQPQQWGAFRTPSLRNVALSPPYMHEGQLATLEDVVRHYDTLEDAVPLGHHSESILKPLGLTAQERADLVAFLRALTADDAASAASSSRGTSGTSPVGRTERPPWAPRPCDKPRS